MAFDIDEGIALMRRAEAAAKWLEETAENLKRFIQDPDNTVGQMAEAYIVGKNLNDTIEEARKKIGVVLQNCAYSFIPERMENEGVSSFTSTIGYRLTMSQRFSASVLDKERAFVWLREHELGDLIQETVNAGSLSSQMRQLIEEENIEPPPTIFKTSFAANVSVTKVKGK